MSPDEKEFGILIGKVEGIGDQITELRRTNGDEHRHTAERFDSLEGLLRTKADTTALEAVATRTRSLEGTRDKQSGGFWLMLKAAGFGTAIVLLVFGALATRVLG